MVTAGVPLTFAPLPVPSTEEELKFAGENGIEEKPTQFWKQKTMVANEVNVRRMDANL